MVFHGCCAFYSLLWSNGVYKLAVNYSVKHLVRLSNRVGYEWHRCLVCVRCYNYAAKLAVRKNLRNLTIQNHGIGVIIKTMLISFYRMYAGIPICLRQTFFMMMSSNGNIFRVTGHLCGEFTGHRWISHTLASDAELWCFRWSAPEWTIE